MVIRQLISTQREKYFHRAHPRSEPVRKKKAHCSRPQGTVMVDGWHPRAGKKETETVEEILTGNPEII